MAPVIPRRLLTDLAHIRFQGTPTVSRSVDLHFGSDPAATSAAESEPHGLAARVLKRFGLNPAVYRTGPLARRTPACLRALRVTSEDEAHARLDADTDLCSAALSSLLIGVSAFFRDTDVFQTVRAAVMPALGRHNRPVRIISIGCASGAELSSTAILAAESNLLNRACFVGLDCRRDAVIAARRGIFPAEALRDVAAEHHARYFEPVSRGYRVTHPLRRRMHWIVWDATRSIPPGPWDLVLCRNLAIYLRPTAGDGLWDAIAQALSPSAFLIVGKAERPPAHLPLTSIGRCVYQAHAD